MQSTAPTESEKERADEPEDVLGHVTGHPTVDGPRTRHVPAAFKVADVVPVRFVLCHTVIPCCTT